LQVGAAHSDSTAEGPGAFVPAATRVTGAVGISVPLPTPGFSIEPYFSPGIRYTNTSGVGNTTKFGYVFGANVSFGVLGAHVAYDSEKLSGGGTRGVLGIGLHAGIHLPLGM
jgi:hypothetical protein